MRPICPFMFKRLHLITLTVLDDLYKVCRFIRCPFYMLTLPVPTISSASNFVHKTPQDIPIYIQQDATLHSLFISENCSTCFGWYLHPSSRAHTTVSTASGTCHTVTATCCYRGGVGTGLSVLWVVYATHSTLKPGTSLPR
jgi:hypothetical protein